MCLELEEILPFKKEFTHLKECVLDQLGYSCTSSMLFELSILVGGNIKDTFNSNVKWKRFKKIAWI